MSRKKSPRSVPVSRDALFQEDEMLPFDDPSEAAMLATLTVEQRMDKFMSKYMALVDPFTVYADYFAHALKESAHILLDIKRNYKTFVLEDGWTEQKYVAVVNALCLGGADINKFTLQAHGSMYDLGKLPSGKKKRSTRRINRR